MTYGSKTPVRAGHAHANRRGACFCATRASHRAKVARRALSKKFAAARCDAEAPCSVNTALYPSSSLTLFPAGAQLAPCIFLEVCCQYGVLQVTEVRQIREVNELLSILLRLTFDLSPSEHTKNHCSMWVRGKKKSSGACRPRAKDSGPAAGPSRPLTRPRWPFERSPGSDSHCHRRDARLPAD